MQRLSDSIEADETGGAAIREQVAPLQRVIGSGGYFALAFGSIVGSAWVLVLGDWLKTAGPGGAALGFVAGGAVMICVAVCYGELAARMPRSGGEFRYVLESLGRPYAFAVGWFIAFGYASFTAFEGIAFAWFIEILLPALRGPVLYRILGHDVTLGSVGLGIGGALFFALVNYRGTSLSITLQKVVTFSFLAIMCALVIAGLAMGRANLQPAFQSLTDRPWTWGALWIFATSAVFLNGFQTALYAIEERRTDVSVRQVILPMILGVLAAAAFYLAVVIAAARSTPWKESASAELSAAFAFGKLTPSGALATVVLLAASISLLKSWNAYVIAGARLVQAQGQQAMLPPAAARVHPRFGSPSVGIGVVLAVNVLGVMLGRGAIVPIVDMCALVNAIAIVLCLIVLLRTRRRAPAQASFMVPGGTSFIVFTTVAVAAMATFALCEPFTRSKGAIPVEWVLMCAWGLIGVVFWNFRRREPTH